jgi:thiamine biosynthesis protein ThiS
MTEGTQDVTINGQPRTVPDPTTVAGLLEHLGVETTHVAVEQNRKLVSKKDYASSPVCAGDELEIVTFVGGG